MNVEIVVPNCQKCNHCLCHCPFVGQVMSSHHMSQGSQVSQKCFSKVSCSHWVSQSVSDQGTYYWAVWGRLNYLKSTMIITGMDRRIPKAPSKQYSSACSASASSSRWRPWGPTAVAANTWKRSSSFFRRRRMPTRTDCISKCNLMQKIVVILFTTEIK